MTAQPIFYQYLMLSVFDNREGIDLSKVNTSDNRLIWQLRPRLGCCYYVCMNALEHGAREEDCSTPLFVGRDIPDYVLDWMNTYAKAVQVGAAWQRHKTRNQK